MLAMNQDNQDPQLIFIWQTCSIFPFFLSSSSRCSIPDMRCCLSRPQTALGLPESPPSSDGKIEVGGGSFNLGENMGPLVVNEDGTAKRIANWGELTAGERENTMRVMDAHLALLSLLRSHATDSSSNVSMLSCSSANNHPRRAFASLGKLHPRDAASGKKKRNT